MNTKFKVGDRVRFIGECLYSFGGNFAGYAKKGDEFIISSVGINGLDGSIMYSVQGSYCEKDPNWLNMEKNFELVKKGKSKKILPPKFLLQYEIDGDPIEEFQTLNEVKKRVKELHEKRGHSFVVYEVKNKIVLDVKEVKTLKIKGI